MIGAVSQLWRYPVKSMRGERCSSFALQHRGVDGDRRYAVRDANGKFGSGKTTRRFRRIDGLLSFSASYVGPHAEIAFPSGESMRSDDARIHQALSANLGEALTLVEEAQVSHLDAAPIHLLTTTSVAWLKAALPDVGIDERRFRPNLLIDAPGSGPVELEWVGKRLRIGEVVELSVVSATERCAMVACSQPELSEEPRVLREIAQKTDVCFGVYAEVVTPGVIHRGDPVTVIVGS